MNTPSHFLVNAGLAKGFGKRLGMVKSAFLFGSIAPDLPLYVLSIAGIIYYRYIKGWSLGRTFERLYDQLFFNDPLWIVSHNFLHAPLILITGIVICWQVSRQSVRRNAEPGTPENVQTQTQANHWANWGFWFFWGCLIHTALDIVTHADDGPLIFFPLNWSIRFQSPVSYWDDRYYGREFARFEAILDLGLTIYLVSPWLWRRWRRWQRSQ